MTTNSSGRIAGTRVPESIPHLRGIHAGRVRAWGEAPHGVTWEIGVRAGRRPLLRLAADGYAAAALPRPRRETTKCV